MATNYNNPGSVRPRVKYVYEDLPEEQTRKLKQNEKSAVGKDKAKLKLTKSPPSMRKMELANDEISNEKSLKQNAAATIKKPVDLKVKCARFTVFACCMVSLIVSFGMLALGVFLKADLTFSQFLSENYRQATETQFTAPTLYKGTWALIVVGCLTIVISFLGCCGAIKENVCMLGTYFAILIVIFLLQITAGVLWYFRRDAIQEEMALALNYMVQSYYQGPGIVAEVMDSIQTVFRCCGNAGCEDYTSLRLTVPRSCDLDCYGCRQRIYRVLRDGFTVITVFGIAMIFAELLAIVCTMYLICRIKERPNPPLVYQLTVQSVPVERSVQLKKSPVADKKSNKATSGPDLNLSSSSSSNPTKIVYVAYPVHAMPPPPPYDGQQRRSPTK